MALPSSCRQSIPAAPSPVWPLVGRIRRQPPTVVHVSLDAGTPAPTGRPAAVRREAESPWCRFGSPSGGAGLGRGQYKTGIGPSRCFYPSTRGALSSKGIYMVHGANAETFTAQYVVYFVALSRPTSRFEIDLSRS